VTVIKTVEHTDHFGNVTKQQTEEEVPLSSWERQQPSNSSEAMIKTPPRKSSSSGQRLQHHHHQHISSPQQVSPRERDPPAQPRHKSHGIPQTALSSWKHLQEEFDIFSYMNLIRAHPKLFLPLLYERRRYYRGKFYKIPGKAPVETEEGEDAVAEAIEFIQKRSPIKEFVYSPGMSLAARDHVIDLGERGLTGTQSTRFPHDTYRDRIERYGKFTGLAVAEHISYGSERAQTIVLDMLIDDGDMSRSHRHHLFSEDWKFVGVAYGDHKRFGHICVVDFCDSYSETSQVSEGVRKPLSFINSTNLKLQDLEDVHYESVPSNRIKQVLSRGPAPRQGGAQLFQRGYDLGISLYSPYSVDLCTADSLVDIVFSIEKDVDRSQLHIVNNGKWYEVKEFFHHGDLVFHGRLTKMERGKLGVLYGNSFLLRFNVE